MIILTGHFLEYEESYAERKNMIPSDTGVIKLCFEDREHLVTGSL